jgi:hypothetical protein
MKKSIATVALIILGVVTMSATEPAKPTSTTKPAKTAQPSGTQYSPSKTAVVNGKPYFEAKSITTRHARVLKIDRPGRRLTLKSEKGDTLVTTVKPEVATFDQIQVGDRIKFTYTEKFTISMDSTNTNTTAPAYSQETMRTDAKPGQKPRVSVTERASYIATISAIDETRGTVTLHEGNGKETTLTPMQPKNLALVKVGDRVAFTSTETMAAELVKESAKPATKPAAKPASTNK